MGYYSATKRNKLLVDANRLISIILSKRINLTKEVEDMYNKTHKTLKEIKDGTN